MRLLSLVLALSLCAIILLSVSIVAGCLINYLVTKSIMVLLTGGIWALVFALSGILFMIIGRREQ